MNTAQPIMSGGTILGTFAAIDFETATASRDSACAVGLTVFENWKVADSKSWLIQPPDNRYDAFNTRIHGLQAADTADAPTFSEIWPQVEQRIAGRLVVAHNTAFDLNVLQRSAAYTSCVVNDMRFICTYRLAKQTWPERWSYKLYDLAEDFGIELDHHNALSDAAAAGELVAHICKANGVPDLESAAEYLGFRIGELTQQSYAGFSNAKGASGRVNLANLESCSESIDHENQLFGKTLVFTGALSTMTRVEAAQAAVNCGAKAANSVSKKVDYLVVGLTDFTRVKDGMSSKMKKAVDLAEDGHPLEIIDEGDFLKMLD
jgi:DNA polymerase III subunit epsilon